jgi:hypothetical protein
MRHKPILLFRRASEYLYKILGLLLCPYDTLTGLCTHCYLHSICLFQDFDIFNESTKPFCSSRAPWENIKFMDLLSPPCSLMCSDMNWTFWGINPLCLLLDPHILYKKVLTYSALLEGPWKIYKIMGLLSSPPNIICSEHITCGIFNN